MYEIHGVTIQMIATEQYFPVVLFITLHQVVLTQSESVGEILKCDHEQYFPVVLFIAPYKVALTNESVDEYIMWWAMKMLLLFTNSNVRCFFKDLNLSKIRCPK